MSPCVAWGRQAVPPETEKGAFVLSKSKGRGCLNSWKRAQAMDKGWAAEGKDGHPKYMLPAVLWEPGFNGHEEDEVLHTRRHSSISLGSQEPFAELVWHPGPALEWAQNRGEY